MDGSRKPRSPRLQPTRLGPIGRRLDALTVRQGRLAFRLGLLGVVVAAALVRAATIRTHLPYLNYYDEFFPLEASAHQLVEGTWDPAFYGYGSLVINLTTITAQVLSWFGAEGLTEGARTTVTSPYTEMVAPPSLILAGRLVVLCSSIATVWLVGLLGARLGGRRAGLVAAALAGALPMFVQRGSIVITDTVATCFVVLAVYAAARLADADRPLRWAVLGGVATGLALATKYTPAPVALVVLAVVIVRTDLGVRARARLLVAAGTAGLVAAVAAMPALVLRTGAVIDTLRSQARLYDLFAATPPYQDQLTSSTEVGVPVVALGMAGLAVLLVTRRTRPLVIGCLAFAAVFLAVLVRSDFQPARNVMPLVPLLCVGAGVAIVEGVRLVDRPLRLGATARAGAVAVALLLVIVPMLRDQVRPHLAERDAVDTRVTARRWLQHHVQPGDDVLVAEELVFLPAELDRIGADVEVLPQAQRIDPSRYDYVVMGFLERAPWAWLIGPEGSVTDGRTLAVAFGSVLTSCERRPKGGPPQPPACPTSPAPRAWLDNQPLIHIYAPSDDLRSRP